MFVAGLMIGIVIGWLFAFLKMVWCDDLKNTEASYYKRRCKKLEQKEVRDDLR